MGPKGLRRRNAPRHTKGTRIDAQTDRHTCTSGRVVHDVGIVVVSVRYVCMVVVPVPEVQPIYTNFVPLVLYIIFATAVVVSHRQILHQLLDK